MFIKVICDNVTSVHECERFHIHPRGDESMGECSEFNINMEPCNISLRIVKDDDKPLYVYVMNKDGKTIDTIYRRHGSKKRGPVLPVPVEPVDQPGVDGMDYDRGGVLPATGHKIPMPPVKRPARDPEFNHPS
jgi:hypothetical protein